MNMTLREFTNRCWYMQRIRVVDRAKRLTSLNEDTFDEATITYVTPHSLRSVAFKEIGDMEVLCFGVLNDELVVEVR